MFRNLRDKGIISYTEYLFLLSILTSKYIHFFTCILFTHSLSFAEPKCGFQIAFNMFDTDGNQRVDKNEFLVVSNLLPLHFLHNALATQNMSTISK